MVVIGAGVMGSAAAHALATGSCTGAGHAGQHRRYKVALLEQHAFGHKHGSSHGDSRIIRPVYAQQH